MGGVVMVGRTALFSEGLSASLFGILGVVLLSPFMLAYPAPQ